MMRKIKMASLILLAFFSISSSAWATDYSTMSTAELSKLRGTMQSASQADRDALHREWMSRVEKMTPAERQQYMGQGKGKGMGMGGGMGGGMGNGMGSGMGSSSGSGGGKGN